MPPKLPPKKDVAIALLQGPSVYVHLDPRKDGVTVPQWFKKQFQLVLQMGMNMAVPIPDLDVGDEGIACTLSFNRSPHWCFLPWSAVYMLVGEDGRGMIWPEDVPPELTIAQQKPKLQVVDNKKTGKTAPADVSDGGEGEGASARPHLAAVPDRAEASDPIAAEEPAEAAGPDEDRVTEEAVPGSTEPEETGDGASEGTAGGDGADGDAADEGADGERKLPPYLRVIK